jgi:hypothetical protein
MHGSTSSTRAASASAHYEETDQYELTLSFLRDRDRFLHYLFADDG